MSIARSRRHVRRLESARFPGRAMTAVSRPGCSRAPGVAMLASLALLIPCPAAATCIEVALHFTDPKPPPALVRSLEDEASAIWTRYGVRIAWNDRHPPECVEAVGSFEVYVSRTAQSPGPTPHPAALGRTWVPDGAIDHLPIRLDRGVAEHVLVSLGEDELVPWFGAFVPAPSDIGRALGRVLAHEIGHVILRAPEHQRRGLMRPSFVAADLYDPTSTANRLSPAEVARLRRRELELSARQHAPGATSTPVPARTAARAASDGSSAQECQAGRRTTPGGLAGLPCRTYLP